MGNKERTCTEVSKDSNMNDSLDEWSGVKMCDRRTKWNIRIMMTGLKNAQ